MTVTDVSDFSLAFFDKVIDLMSSPPLMYFVGVACFAYVISIVFRLLRN